ncbi:MAG: hypothetical protein DWI57_10720 [Chloroflexi bacterium]|nr:MAG: hypothetical protein DWI57_10720 [Chloroflexota bacterium]
MNASLIERMEIEISQLALSDQLWLLERLIQRIRKRTLRTRPALETQLAAMAYDPNMQRELKAIEAEFATTEADGLGVNG